MLKSEFEPCDKCPIVKLIADDNLVIGNSAIESVIRWNNGEIGPTQPLSFSSEASACAVACIRICFSNETVFTDKNLLGDYY
mgnify:CR=1 FL=1